MNRLYFGLLYSLLFFTATISHTSHSPIIMLSTLRFHSAPVDSAIADKCNEYVESKGFYGINFATLNKRYFPLGVYAFVLQHLHPRTIFFSSEMIDSIKNGLEKEQSLPIYDKFVLLHELGHYHPYGLGAPEQDPLLIQGLFLCYVATLFFTVQHEEAHRGRETVWYPISKGILLASFAMIAQGFHNTKKVDVYRRKFKKYRFKHADLEFQKHIQDACEEQDADSFAYRLLSATELHDLHAYLFSCETYTDENAYHSTPAERCVAIKAELARRENA